MYKKEPDFLQFADQYGTSARDVNYGGQGTASPLITDLIVSKTVKKVNGCQEQKSMNSTELLNSKKTKNEGVNLKTHLSNSSMISAEVGAVTSSCQTTGMSPLRLIGSGDKFKNFPV